MSNIEKDAIKYKDAEKLAVKYLAQGYMKEFIQKVCELKEIKESIKKTLLEKPLFTIKDKEAARIIKNINENKDLPLEKSSKGTFFNEFLSEEFTEDELAEIGSDIFYSWYSHYEYIRGLSKVGALILNCDRIPIYLEKFTDEARQCFAFQQYNAVFSLCRTMLEITVKELCINNGILPRESEKIKKLENYQTSLNYLIDQISEYPQFKPHKVRLHWLRRKTNFVVHGNKSTNESEAEEILKETYNTISLVLK